ncbi:MAG: CaiB/BaiF CoA transferase family protein [Chloroflexota bacterium]
MNATTAPAGLLSGVRVLDLTRFLAGPFATLTLGDMGADVIKVESREGDDTRYLPPHFVHEDSAYFLSVNRNKRSIVVDLKSQAGMEVIRKLVQRSDVVLDNLREPQRRRLGLAYEQLREVNPRIISCSITGFGSWGPYRDRPAYDMIVQALSGVMSLTGERGGRPVRCGIPIGDVAAGMYAVMAIQGALYERERSGQGQQLDISMLDCQVAMLSYLGAYYLTSGQVPGPQGRSHDSIPTYNVFRAQDGIEVVVTANTEGMWVSLCKALGMESLASDPRFRLNVDRHANRAELIPILEQAFAAQPGGYWLETLDAAGVACAPIQTMDRVMQDPQVAARQMVVEVPHRQGGTVRLIGNPIKASRNSDLPLNSPPGLGQHTEELLLELGYSERDIQRLMAENAVGGPLKSKA